MTLDDETRPQSAGRPAWAEAPNLVVPTLQLVPISADCWLVQFMFPSRHQRGAFSWIAWRADDFAELEQFLLDWWASPEDCIRKYYHEEPPKGRVWEIPRTIETVDAGDVSLADLDL